MRTNGNCLLTGAGQSAIGVPGSPHPTPRTHPAPAHPFLSICLRILQLSGRLPRFQKYATSFRPPTRGSTAASSFGPLEGSGLECVDWESSSVLRGLPAPLSACLPKLVRDSSAETKCPDVMWCSSASLHGCGLRGHRPVSQNRRKFGMHLEES